MNGGNVKIAIVVEDGNVAQHFGHCEKVMLVTIENGEVDSREVLDAPEHECGALPRLFAERQVEYVIAGGLGGGALANLNLSLIHISEPTRLGMISYAVFCLKK